MSHTRSRLSKVDGNAQPNIDAKPKIEDVESGDEQLYFFNGTYYPSYDELVKAKRKRNAEVLAKSGLFEAAMALSDSVKRPATSRGIRPDNRRKEENTSTTIRRSSRLAGVQSDGLYIEEERSGMNIKIGQNGHIVEGNTSTLSELNIPQKAAYFKDRVNDGSDLTVQNAVELCDTKWKSESHILSATSFFHNFTSSSKESGMKSSTSTMATKIHALSVDEDTCVSKVVPDRIYSVAFHPSPHKLIAVAGDKQGYIGFWDVDHQIHAADNKSNDSDSVHLLKLYNRPVSNLEWNREGTKLMSSSYDGSVRLFDIQKETISEVFATYNDSDEYKNKVGYGLDLDYRYWVQFVTFDPRNDNCLFASTSLGDVLHIDLRDKAQLSFNQKLSDKKINTVRYVYISLGLICLILFLSITNEEGILYFSLHPNGHTLATAGLDCTLYLWDIRHFQAGSKGGPVAMARSISSKSINSAFFSPSGKNIVTTTMANTLDIFMDAHTKSNLISKPTHRIRHDNQTGRWLSTFMARWHPTHTNEEIFVVGSMQQPRTVEVFDASKGEVVRGIQGSSLSSVMSRCCIHPSQTEMMILGGNSSGRMIVAR